MIAQKTIFDIHRLKDLDFSVRYIAKELNLNRSTVKKYIEEPVSSYTQNIPRPSKLTPFHKLIDHILGQSHHIKATVIFQRLKAEGFDGGIRIVRNYLLKKRGHAKRLAPSSQVDFSELEHIWMLRLLQGDIRCDELENKFSGKLNSKSICKLHHAILNMPLRFRNRAIAIFAYYKGISQRSIARCLYLNREAIQGYVRSFKSGGVERLFDQSRKKVKKNEDPKYKEAVFQILHAPPLSYNINRTTWRMRDLHSVLAMKGYGLSYCYIRKIIKEAGYRFRKAKKNLTSNDPNYREKLQKITDILMNLVLLL
jgi:transposase